MILGCFCLMITDIKNTVSISVLFVRNLTRIHQLLMRYGEIVTYFESWQDVCICRTNFYSQLQLSKTKRLYNGMRSRFYKWKFVELKLHYQICFQDIIECVNILIRNCEVQRWNHSRGFQIFRFTVPPFIASRLSVSWSRSLRLSCKYVLEFSN